MGVKEMEVCRSPCGVAWMCPAQKEARGGSWVNGRWEDASLEEVVHSVEEVAHPLAVGRKTLEGHSNLAQESPW